jgi:hypothetical protein
MKIKYPAVIVATLVHYILGGLWYSPLLFGNKFVQIINWSPGKLAEVEKQSHAKELAIAFRGLVGFGLHSRPLCSVH